MFTPYEVESILNVLPLGKAAGLDGIKNRTLRELSKELHVAPPIRSFFSQTYVMEKSLSASKRLAYVLCIKMVTLLLFLITGKYITKQSGQSLRKTSFKIYL